MAETRTVHDPFLGRDVQVSNRLTDRLRGKYASGPTLPSGEPEFGYRQFETPPIQHEAADTIDALVKALQLARARIEYLGAVCSHKKHFKSNASDFLPAIDNALAKVSS